MKSHISATIDRNLLERVDQYRKSVRRSRSQVIELAIDRMLKEEEGTDEGIRVTSGKFTGDFNREATYAR